MSELTPERIEDMMRRFGYTEPEARAAVYLEQAEELLTELEKESYPGHGLGYMVWEETHIIEHFRELRRVLGARVLRRDYPEGWGSTAPKEDEESHQG